MRLPLLCFAIAVALYACSREGPAAGQTPPSRETQAVPAGQAVAQAHIDETRQAEKAEDEGKPLSDTSLTQIVREALESESSLDARTIDVENRKGNITLHGEVDSEAQREKAGRIAGSVGGVHEVVNNLTVEPSAATGGTVPRKD